MLYEISEKTIQLENQGKEIIKFNLGDPDMPTPPEIIEAAYQAMKNGKTKYSSAAGEKALRKELAQIHDVSVDNVVIPSPHWTSYELAARSVGAELRFLKGNLESNWKIDVERLEDLLDNNTRIIILNSPSNPTSKVIDEKTFSEIVQIAGSRGITIMSDEVYSDISFVKTRSILDFGMENILVNSFSKTFLMTGWRVGYIIAKEEFVQKLVKFNQMTTTCVPAFVQYGALKGLESRKQIAADIRKEFRVRVATAVDVLSKAKMKFSRPDAPFYLFPKVDGLDSESFALDLLDHGVAIAPGTAFGDYREYFRISLTTGEAKIKEGLEKLCEALP